MSNTEAQTGKTLTHIVYLTVRETKNLTHLVRIGEACANEDGMKVTIWLDHAIPQNSKAILHLDPTNKHNSHRRVHNPPFFSKEHLMHEQSEKTFNLIFEGQEIIVHYHPRRFSDYDHFEFLSPFYPKRPIPVSATGYRSHFVPNWEVGATADVETYAQEILVLMMAAACKHSLDDDQLALF